jgi:hypothetical protein
MQSKVRNKSTMISGAPEITSQQREWPTHTRTGDRQAVRAHKTPQQRTNCSAMDVTHERTLSERNQAQTFQSIQQRLGVNGRQELTIAKRFRLRGITGHHLNCVLVQVDQCGLFHRQLTEFIVRAASTRASEEEGCSTEATWYTRRECVSE